MNIRSNLTGDLSINDSPLSGIFMHIKKIPHHLTPFWKRFLKFFQYLKILEKTEEFQFYSDYSRNFEKLIEG